MREVLDKTVRNPQVIKSYPGSQDFAPILNVRGLFNWLPDPCRGVSNCVEPVDLSLTDSQDHRVGIVVNVNVDSPFAEDSYPPRGDVRVVVIAVTRDGLRDEIEIDIRDTDPYSLSVWKSPVDGIPGSELVVETSVLQSREYRVITFRDSILRLENPLSESNPVVATGTGGMFAATQVNVLAPSGLDAVPRVVQVCDRETVFSESPNDPFLSEPIEDVFVVTQVASWSIDKWDREPKLIETFTVPFDDGVVPAEWRDYCTDATFKSPGRIDLTLPLDQP